MVGEISEETGWQVTAGLIPDCWQYHIREGCDVVIVTYGCHVSDNRLQYTYRELRDADAAKGITVTAIAHRWDGSARASGVPGPG